MKQRHQLPQLDGGLFLTDGGIETARGPEMFLPLWLRLMGTLGTGRFNIKVVR